MGKPWVHKQPRQGLTTTSNKREASRDQSGLPSIAKNSAKMRLCGGLLNMLPGSIARASGQTAAILAFSFTAPSRLRLSNIVPDTQVEVASPRLGRAGKRRSRNLATFTQ
jgi:hypothetical protein